MASCITGKALVILDSACFQPLRSTREGDREIFTPLGEGGHDLGLVDEEGGVEALGFQVVSHQLVQQPRR